MNTTSRIGAGILGIAVCCGAMGSHILKQILSEAALANWQTAVQYQVMHGLALFILGRLPVPKKATRVIVPLFVAGVIIFSGGLYAVALTGYKPLGRVIPLGGAAWIVAWAILVFTRNVNQNTT